MKKSERITEKRMYKNPRIEVIKLDNEISLALESTPPQGPGEGTSLTQEFMNIDPFKNNMG